MRIDTDYIDLSENFFSVVPTPKGVYFLSENHCHVSNSQLVADLARRADGSRQVSQILKDLSDHPVRNVEFAIEQLCDQGVLQLRSAPQPQPAQDLYHCFEHKGVTLVSDTVAAISLMKDVLDSSNLKNIARFDNDKIHLFLTSDFRAPFPEMPSSDTLWIPVKLVGERSYFGPVIGGSEPACPHCLQRRFRISRPVESHLEQTLGEFVGEPRPDRLGLGPYARDTAKAVCRVIETLGAESSLKENPFVTEHTEHGLMLHALGLPGCPRCRRPNTATPSAVRSGMSQIKMRRGQSIAAILPSLRSQVSDLTGLVRHVGPLDTGLTEIGAPKRHLWEAQYPVQPGVKTPAADMFHGVVVGNGLTAEEAEANAISKAIRRQSAQFPDHASPQKASLSELGAAAIAPNDVWLFSAAQFFERKCWNAHVSEQTCYVPEPLAADQPIDWIQVRSLTEGTPKWMAREHCYDNAPAPHYGRFDNQGCASGATLDEALLKALLELIERDAAAIWWFNRIPRPAVSIDTLIDPRVRRLAQGIREQGWLCWMLDLTTDLGVPCYAALARANRDGRWCVGFGCHLDGDLAAERAMTDLSMRFGADGHHGPLPWDPMDHVEETFLWPEGKTDLRFALCPETRDCGGMAAWLITQLAAKGIEVLMLDQTRPDTGFPVVKAFAPGLRPFGKHFAPGRLYDVPVEMGWRDAPLCEAELNYTRLYL